MNFEIISEIAEEHRFCSIECETPELVSFIKNTTNGRIRINFAEKQQIVTLIIRKENVKGFKNFLKTFHPLDFNLVYEIFHSPNKFRIKK